jgi:hypothetical protein
MGRADQDKFWDLRQPAFHAPPGQPQNDL